MDFVRIDVLKRRRNILTVVHNGPSATNSLGRNNDNHVSLDTGSILRKKRLRDSGRTSMTPLRAHARKLFDAFRNMEKPIGGESFCDLLIHQIIS
jgi:hypothetical protein